MPAEFSSLLRPGQRCRALIAFASRLLGRLESLFLVDVVIQAYTYFMLHPHQRARIGSNRGVENTPLIYHGHFRALSRAEEK
jgi:hypothetical protein